MFTPCGIQTHNLQIRSLTRCSVAPTGQGKGQKQAVGFYGFFFSCADATKKNGKNAPGGTRTPDPGLIRPMLYQTELPERMRAHARDRTKDLQIFSLTLSQLSYIGGSASVGRKPAGRRAPKKRKTKTKQKRIACACRELNPDLMLGKHQ